MLTDKNTINNFYYKSTSKLDIRKDFWLKYWTNPISYNDWVISNIWIRNLGYENLLDIWCGLGDFLFEIQKRYNNISLYGIDLSGSMVSSSIKKLRDSATITNEDIHNLSFADGYFNYITCLHVLHHVEKVEQAIEELYTKLRVGWTLCIVVGRYLMDHGLNKIHYESLGKLWFPEFMQDRTQYNSIDENFLEKLLVKKFWFFEKLLYKNDAILKEAPILLKYYKSAMMYRWSFGKEDTRISNGLWEKLESCVNLEILEEINKHGSFTHPWEILLYKVTK